MTRSLYGLLVGIDAYPSPTPPLQGCISDIAAVQECLEGRVISDRYQLHIRSLSNSEATRKAVIDGFRQHLCQAGSEDIVLFYFAGHGAQEAAPEEFWHLEPDRLDETLVCYDSRCEGGWDLADKELAKLLSEVAEKNPHIAVILDCCHSGSGTRGDLELETAVRCAPVDKRKRSSESFIVSSRELEHLFTNRDLDQNPSGWTLPRGKHICLAACRDIEEAKEYSAAGKRRGVFSYFLTDTLKKANGSLTYRDLFKRTHALVLSKVTAQSPQMEATASSELDQLFLGGVISPRTPYFTVSFHRHYGWVIDGGAIHGIPQPLAGQTTQLALFPFNCTAEQLHQPSAALGEAQILEVMPQVSKVSITGFSDLNSEMTFKAIVTSLPLPPMGVWIEGEATGVKLARQALATAELKNHRSLYVREVPKTEAAEFQLLAKEGQYLITRPADDRPLVGQIDNYTSASVAQVIHRLEHIARWTNIVELSSPAVSRIHPDAIRMQIFQSGQELKDTEICLKYRQEGDKQKQPTFQIKLTNTGNEPLYCAVLALTQRYAVSAGLFETGGVWLQPFEEAWAAGGKSLYASVPKEMWELGVTEVRDIFKLIVSTAEFDATLLEQDNLDSPRTTRSFTTQQRGTLNHLMNRVQTREVRVVPEEDELYDDWIASQVIITTVRPKETKSVPNGTKNISLGSEVQLQPHPSLRAQARLTTVTQATRDIGNHILPPILLQHDSMTQPFQFTSSRGSDPGLGVLELSRVMDSSVVTPEEPLKLTVDALLEEEHLLPISYDGEFFLPLGYGRRTTDDKTEIVLERLPDPIPVPEDASEDRRSLASSIRIFFQKVVSQKLGLEFTYPHLAAVEIDFDGTARYEVQPDKVKERVVKARRIVLYIHGIIGDTFSMVPSLQQSKIEMEGEQKTLANLYDLVLAFDYENLNTSIEENARLLKQHLSVLGLGPYHAKVLHIVAHSMGGLVSRWFIEREGGNQIVQHLIMLGTPNAGSPWPNIQKWATAAIGIGLNSLSTVAWPVKVLGTLISAIETIDVSLDQMEPDSEFLKSLWESNDPAIPYTIIAGNTSIIPAALQLQSCQSSSTLERLFKKLFNTVAELPFFGQPNDIAVTVHSIKNIPAGRLPEPKIYEVGCDHLVYFIDSAGLEGLATALIQAQQHVVCIISTPVSLPEPDLKGDLGNKLQKSTKPQWLTGLIVGVVVALAVVGFLLWENSRDRKPSKSFAVESHQF